MITNKPPKTKCHSPIRLSEQLDSQGWLSDTQRQTKGTEKETVSKRIVADRLTWTHDRGGEQDQTSPCCCAQMWSWYLFAAWQYSAPDNPKLVSHCSMVAFTSEGIFKTDWLSSHGNESCVWKSHKTNSCIPNSMSMWGTRLNTSWWGCFDMD